MRTLPDIDMDFPPDWQYRVWLWMTDYVAKSVVAGNQFDIKGVLDYKIVTTAQEDIREMDEDIIYDAAMGEWESQHRLPRRLKKRKRDVSHAHMYKSHFRRPSGWEFEDVAHSPRSSLRDRRGCVVPPIPDDLGRAWLESVLEEYGWPIEQDDSHPRMAEYRKQRQDRDEREALYFDDYMRSIDRYEEDQMYEEITEAYDDY